MITGVCTKGTKRLRGKKILPNRASNAAWALLFFQLHTAAFKAYCAIWVRRSNFRHQASPRVSPRQEHPAAEGGIVGEKCLVILPKCQLPHYIQGSFTCRKATTWDRQLYFPSEGRRAEDFFFALKIPRHRPGANP